MKKAEREALKRQKFRQMKLMDLSYKEKGFKYVIGIDEVGRGPLAGPVVAAAVILPSDFNFMGIDDSKKLSDKKREEAFNEIVSRAKAWGIGYADHLRIDEINILQATKEAMAMAVDECLKMLGDTSEDEYVLLIDGDKTIEDKTDYKHQDAIIKGDGKSLAIGAASIVAKVTRDRFMEEMDSIFPGYDLASNKGYPTASHYKGIDQLGICEIHRKTFLKKYFEQ